MGDHAMDLSVAMMGMIAMATRDTARIVTMMIIMMITTSVDMIATMTVEVITMTAVIITMIVVIMVAVIIKVIVVTMVAGIFTMIAMIITMITMIITMTTMIITMTVDKTHNYKATKSDLQAHPSLFLFQWRVKFINIWLFLTSILINNIDMNIYIYMFTMKK